MTTLNSTIPSFVSLSRLEGLSFFESNINNDNDANVLYRTYTYDDKESSDNTDTRICNILLCSGFRTKGLFFVYPLALKYFSPLP